MNKLMKIHIGLIIGIVMTFVSLLILIINFNIKVNIFVPFALLLTYEYLIISFLKDNFLTADFKSKTIKDLSEYNFRRVNIYRKIIYFIQAVCIILAPVMWMLVIYNV